MTQEKHPTLKHEKNYIKKNCTLYDYLAKKNLEVPSASWNH